VGDADSLDDCRDVEDVEDPAADVAVRGMKARGLLNAFAS